ncbi:hypothetical protein ACQY0O_001038 [Thecaphora frezii]
MRASSSLGPSRQTLNSDWLEPRTTLTRGVQKPGLSQTAKSRQRADKIKQAFKQSYNEYKKYAFGYDEVKPLSKQGATSYGGWGATIVDALSTAHLMGHGDIFAEGVARMKEVDFTKTTQAGVSLFETTIRYLGGLLSAYELDGESDAALLRQAIIIGDRLLTGWVANNDIPYNNLKGWNTRGKPDTTTDANIAEAGTLLLEFDRLSKFSGDRKYLEHAERAMRAIINSDAVFPGLYAQNLRPSDALRTSDYVTFGGGSDSFYEYLIKYAYLIGDDTGPWIPTWIDSVKSGIKHLVTRAEATSRNLTYITDYSESNGGVLPRFSHLGCFLPGNWMLGSKVLGIERFNDYALLLAESCINTYTASPSGIGPESFVFVAAGGNERGVNIYDRDFYRRNGFEFEDVGYALRPETIESLFYAWRTTGDTRWQELAWQAYLAIERHCKAPAAYAALRNVDATEPTQSDSSQSFLYAETFKYLYLVFADPKLANLDDYVFNTEAHPFKVDQPAKSYHAEWGIIPEPIQLQAKTSGTKKPTGKVRRQGDDEDEVLEERDGGSDHGVLRARSADGTRRHHHPRRQGGGSGADASANARGSVGSNPDVFARFNNIARGASNGGAYFNLGSEASNDGADFTSGGLGWKRDADIKSKDLRGRGGSGEEHDAEDLDRDRVRDGFDNDAHAAADPEVTFQSKWPKPKVL